MCTEEEKKNIITGNALKSEDPDKRKTFIVNVVFLTCTETSTTKFKYIFIFNFFRKK